MFKYITFFILIFITGCCSAQGRSSTYGDGEHGVLIKKTNVYDSSRGSEFHSTEFDASDDDGWCNGYSNWSKY